MILHDPTAKPSGGRVTLDELLRRAALRRPDAVALIDPPNRASFTDGSPRRLTYAQADRAVSAIAARLRQIGLPIDAIVGIQFANTIDGVLTLLGVLRAGLIAMPLPLLWRRAELVAALNRVSASALIVGGRVGATDHFDLAMNVAAQIFPIRYVCGFGRDAPDGVIPFDDLLSAEALELAPDFAAERGAEPGSAAHLAVITWDMSAEGLVPVARNHAELITGGLDVLLESRMAQDAVVLATLMLSSFAGIASVVMPWLLLGGTLALHQPFDPATFLMQRQVVGPDVAIVPGPLVAALEQSGHLSAQDGLKIVIGVWRSPERLLGTPAWRNSQIRMVDVQVFGETAVIAAMRGQSGKPVAIPFGLVFAPRGPRGTVVVADIAATAAGTVAVRGPMVPRAAFPPGAERSGLPHLNLTTGGYVDTGFACHGAPAMVVTGSPPGLVSVGGYRFAERDLEAALKEAGSRDGHLTALPDPLAGHRLAGSGAEHAAIRAALCEAGSNPLLIGAFRDRHRAAA